MTSIFELNQDNVKMN